MLLMRTNKQTTSKDRATQLLIWEPLSFANYFEFSPSSPHTQSFQPLHKWVECSKRLEKKHDENIFCPTRSIFEKYIWCQKIYLIDKYISYFRCQLSNCWKKFPSFTSFLSTQWLLICDSQKEMDFLNRQYHCKRITQVCKYFHASAFYEKLPQFGLMCCACLCHVCATLKCDTLGHMSATNIASFCWLLAGCVL